MIAKFILQKQKKKKKTLIVAKQSKSTTLLACCGVGMYPALDVLEIQVQFRQ